MQKKPIFTPNTGVMQNPLIKAEVTETQNSEQAPETEKSKTKQPYLPVVKVNDLPSRYSPYPSGTEISYHPYTFGELKKFSQSKLSIKQRYEFILEGILVTGIKKEQITFHDFLFLAMLRKLSSVGVGSITVKYRCNKCGFENSNQVQFDTLEFEDMKVPEFPAYMEINGKEMEFTPITVGDYFTLFKEGKDKDQVAVPAIQCRNLGFSEAYDLIYKANPEDSEMLNELDKMFYHGLKSLKFPCQNKEAVEMEMLEGVEIEKTVHCDYTNQIELEDTGLIVQPFRGNGESPKDRIRFGNRAGNKSGAS